MRSVAPLLVSVLYLGAAGASPVAAQAGPSVLVITSDSSAPLANALRMELAPLGFGVQIVPPPPDVSLESVRALARAASASAAVWVSEDRDGAGVHVLWLDGGAGEARLPPGVTAGSRTVALVMSSLLEETRSPDPLEPVAGSALPGPVVPLAPRRPAEGRSRAAALGNPVPVAEDGGGATWYFAVGGGYSPRWGDDDTLRHGATLRFRAGVQFESFRVGAITRVHQFNDWLRRPSDSGGEARTVLSGWYPGVSWGLEAGIRESVGLFSLHASGFVAGGGEALLRFEEESASGIPAPSLSVGGEVGLGVALRSNFDLVLAMSLHALLREGGAPTLVPGLTLMSDWH